MDDEFSLVQFLWYNVWNRSALIAILAYSILIFSIPYFRRKPKILNTVPGFCTGVGVLLTFIVLYNKLNNFEYPVGSEANTYLEDLIVDIASAFSTSIIGVICSLIANPIVKDRIQRIESKALGGVIQKHPQLLMQEMVDGIQRNNQLMSKNSEHVESMTTTLNKLATGIEERMDTMFNNLGATLTQSINDLNTLTIENAAKNAEKINQQFLDNSQEILRVNGQELAKATEANQENLQTILGEMKGLATLIKEQMETTKTTADQSVLAIQEGFKTSTTEMTTQLDSRTTELVGSLDEINTTISGFNEELQESTTKVLSDNLRLLVEAFEKIEKLNESTQSNLNQTTGQFAEAVNQYEQAKHENKLIADQIGKQIKRNKKQQKQMGELLDRWVQLSEDVNTMQNRVADIAITISSLHAIQEDIKANSSNG